MANSEYFCNDSRPDTPCSHPVLSGSRPVTPSPSWIYGRLFPLDFVSILQPAAVGTGGESSGLCPYPGAVVSCQIFYGTL